MSFESVHDLLQWYAESKYILRDLKDRLEYDDTNPVHVLLNMLTELYCPLQCVDAGILTEDRLTQIMSSLLKKWDLDEFYDIKEVKEMSTFYTRNGLVEKRAISSGEMASEIGYARLRFRRLIKRLEDKIPIQFAWRTPGGHWRFSVEQIDNFKRWLYNYNKLPAQPPQDEPCINAFESGQILPADIKGNVYEIEDAEYTQRFY